MGFHTATSRGTKLIKIGARRAMRHKVRTLTLRSHQKTLIQHVDRLVTHSYVRLTGQLFRDCLIAVMFLRPLTNPRQFFTALRTNDQINCRAICIRNCRDSPLVWVLWYHFF